jgi:membrane protein CcdC involved in cytochrome C biogenesis
MGTGMQVHTGQPQGWIQYAVPTAIFVLVFAFRARRLTQLRPLRIERLWIFPTIYLLVCAGMLVQFPPTLFGWGLCAVALAVGVVLGWQRGKTMRITVDPETHQLNQKASLAGIFFLFAIIGLRAAARAGSSALHLNVAMLTDTLVVLALGLFAAQRVEMYLRAKRLLDEARAAKA